MAMASTVAEGLVPNPIFQAANRIPVQFSTGSTQRETSPRSLGRQFSVGSSQTTGSLCSSIFPGGTYNEHAKQLNLFPENSPEVAIEWVRTGELMEKETDEELHTKFSNLTRELKKSFSKSLVSASHTVQRYYFIVVYDEDPALTELRWGIDRSSAASTNAVGKVPCVNIKYISTNFLHDEDKPLDRFADPSQDPDCGADLRIVCIGRTLKLRAPTRESMKKWMTAMNLIVSRNRKQVGPRSGNMNMFNKHELDTLNQHEDEWQKRADRIHEVFSETIGDPIASQKADTAVSNKIDLTDIHHSANVKKSLTPWYRKYAQQGLGRDSTQYLMSQQLFQEFLRVVQQETYFFGVQRETSHLFEKLREPFVEQIEGQRFLTEAGFSHVMCCAENSLFHPSRRARVHQDMTKPLSHYWISSSHNTYLEGHQWVGESSLNRYIDVLMAGCRCVEIDCWDGESGEPAVTHGWTMTTKLGLRDVIRICRDYGFITTPYPLILSLEVHCCPEQQQRIAEILHEVLGSRLLLHNCYEDFESAELPSPQEAKRKVIIKAKVPLVIQKPTTFRQRLTRSSSSKSCMSSRSQSSSRIGPSDSTKSFTSEDSFFINSGPSAGTVKSKARITLCGLCGRSPAKRRTAEASQETAIASPPDDSPLGDDTKPDHAEGTISDEWEISPRRRVERINSGCSFTSEASDGFISEDQMRSINVFESGSLYSNTIYMPTAHFPKRCRHPPTSLLHACTITSFNDRNATKVMTVLGLKALQAHHSARLSRVYPNPYHTSSTNFDPVPLWCAGFQFVALNYQTLDHHTVVNAGLFMNENGGCGYILKPPTVLGACAEADHPCSSSGTVASHNNICESKGCTLELNIISAHGLPISDNTSGTDSTHLSVIVTVSGSSDPATNFQTHCAPRHDPSWSQVFSFDVPCPEVSILKFEVVELANGGDSKFVAAAALPMSGLREGIRWVSLLDRRLHSIEYCGLLVEARSRGPWSVVRSAQLAKEQRDVLSARLTSRSMGGLGDGSSCAKVDLNSACGESVGDEGRPVTPPSLVTQPSLVSSFPREISI